MSTHQPSHAPRRGPRALRSTARSVVGLVVVGMVASGAVTASADHSGSTPSAGPSPSLEEEFFELLNDARRDEGLRALRRVDGVDNVAREWSEVMAEDNELKHRPDLRAPFDGAWQRLGENVGVGFSAQKLHQGFMDSPGHYANIVGNYDYVGIGVALAGSRTWVTFNFVGGDPDTRSTYANNPLTGGYATGHGEGGSYYDIDRSVHVNDIDALDDRGIAISCAGLRYCPDDPLRRSEMAVMLVRMLNLPPATERFVDVSSSHPYRAEIGALAAAGITKGCNPPANDRFCPESTVTRQQMASFFTRALELTPTTNTFTDVTSNNVHRNDIGALGRSGITKGCNPPSNTRYCPSNPVTRGQMASFIVRALNR